MLDFSLIVPTYNERENLPELFARVDRVLRGYAFEMILVDDDSPDGTWAAAENFREQYSWLRVIRRRHERGLSSAVLCGFRHARGQVLGVMDADLQHDDRRLPDLLRAMDHSDFAIATRRAAGGSDRCWTRSRRLTSQVATLLARAIAKVRLSDPMSGFFTMRRDVFAAIDDAALRPRGYKILLYLYSLAVKRFGANQLRLEELGYQFGKREHGESKLSSKVMLEYLLMLLDLGLTSRAKFPRPRFAPALF